MSNKDLLRALCDTADHRPKRKGYLRMAFAAVIILAVAYAYHLASKPMDGGRGDKVNWHSMAHEGAGRTR